jgi:hypothetical protein
MADMTKQDETTIDEPSIIPHNEDGDKAVEELRNSEFYKKMERCITDPCLRSIALSSLERKIRCGYRIEDLFGEVD